MLEVGYFKTAASAVETIRFYRDLNPDFRCILKRVKVLGKPIWILRRWGK